MTEQSIAVTMEGNRRTHEATATANPRAVATLTGLVGLRGCEMTENGVIWRLDLGVTVSLTLQRDGSVHWHLDQDDEAES